MLPADGDRLVGGVTAASGASPDARRVALVTGASTGIGRATALALALRGCAVAVNYLSSRGSAEAVVDRIAAGGGRAVALQADVTDAAAVRRLVGETQAQLGPIDILVNNAGGAVAPATFPDCDERLWDQALALNLKSVYLVTHAVVAGMMARRQGRIVNVSSLAAVSGAPGGMVHYAAAKGAVNSLTLGLGRELAPWGISVNAVAPGIVDTPFQDKYPSPRTVELVAATPAGRAGTPDEVAAVVAFLACDASPFLTAEIIAVGGGR